MLRTKTTRRGRINRVIGLIGLEDDRIKRGVRINRIGG
jgi:hypothetical protein